MFTRLAANPSHIPHRQKKGLSWFETSPSCMACSRGRVANSACAGSGYCGGGGGGTAAGGGGRARSRCSSTKGCGACRRRKGPAGLGSCRQVPGPESGCLAGCGSDDCCNQCCHNCSAFAGGGGSGSKGCGAPPPTPPTSDATMIWLPSRSPSQMQSAPDAARP